MTDSRKSKISQPVTTQAMMFNVLEIATQLEEIIKPFAPPYSLGVYLPDSFDPVLIPGNAYVYEVIESQPVAYRYLPVTDMAAALTEPWDILSGPEGNVVVTHAQLRNATLKPQLPVYGLKLIHDIVFNTVFSALAHSNYPQLEKIDVIKKYINFNDIIPGPASEWQKHERAYQTTEKVYAECADLLRYIHNFIGEKGMYAMYDLNFHTSATLSLVYTGDYRVMDWHRRMDEGTWV